MGCNGQLCMYGEIFLLLLIEDTAGPAFDTDFLYIKESYSLHSNSCMVFVDNNNNLQIVSECKVSLDRIEPAYAEDSGFFGKEAADTLARLSSLSKG